MQKNAKSSLKDVIVVGFAMFAIFFGAGNLIFPPYLGMVSGQEWFKGFLCFMIADAGLAVMTVLAMIRYDGTVWSMLRRLSKPAAAVMATVAMLCVGPLLCIPRTCATTFEMGVLPLFPECSPWLFGALFFGAVFILTVRPSAVIDIIGKFLTPALLLTLAVLFVKGVIHPIGTISTAAPAVNVAQEGLLAGYQTMDVFGALAITLVVVNTVKEKGYSEEKLRFSVISKSSIVAALGLFFVYCALSFLGATSSELELGAVNQAGLVVTITELLLQRFGVVLLAKNAHIHALMNEEHRLGRIQKTYHALVYGGPEAETGLIDAPIARLPLPSLLRQVREDGKPSRTEYRVLERRKGTAVLELRPLTGRTHQLRVHCSYMGWPILGDPQYGSESSMALSRRLGLTTQALCAKKLRFFHPMTGREMELVSQLKVPKERLDEN